MLHGHQSSVGQRGHGVPPLDQFGTDVWQSEAVPSLSSPTVLFTCHKNVTIFSCHLHKYFFQRYRFRARSPRFFLELVATRLLVEKALTRFLGYHLPLSCYSTVRFGRIPGCAQLAHPDIVCLFKRVQADNIWMQEENKEWSSNNNTVDNVRET